VRFRMSMRSLVAGIAVFVSGIACAADGPKLGQPISDADLAPWDISIAPDGSGLPPGSGTAMKGGPIFIQRCISCHGEAGAGAPFGGPLVGSKDQQKRVGSYWPKATAIFDFTRRAMPWGRPGTLTNDEVYALTAYILFLNEIIGENDVINAETLPKVAMPNKDGFVTMYPARQ
jgi:mono/diheme cytochrome c family protein